ncbi:hypothetical protein PR048_024732 [Dryococelus australis]|uniref:Uncharacterized protein n=1 Tax=Dryococelus australis TaxID=614101 RepID=A0ABQ9GPF4_9NEOP|nr:hypothetical protein PR048_024732 [Dryococelus australis]
MLELRLGSSSVTLLAIDHARIKRKPNPPHDSFMSIETQVVRKSLESLLDQDRNYLTQSPQSGHSQIFASKGSCRTMLLVGGFSRGSIVSPAPSLRRCSIFTPITLIGSLDLVVKSRPILFIRVITLVSYTSTDVLSHYRHPNYCRYIFLVYRKHMYKLGHEIRDWKRGRLMYETYGPSQIIRAVAAPKGGGRQGHYATRAETSCIPGRLTPEVRMVASCRTVPLVDEFTRGSPVCLNHPRRLSRPRCYVPPHTLHTFGEESPLHSSGCATVRSSAGMQGRGKREIPEKTRRPVASSGTISTCEDTGATPLGFEPDTPRWEATSSGVNLFRMKSMQRVVGGNESGTVRTSASADYIGHGLGCMLHISFGCWPRVSMREDISCLPGSLRMKSRCVRDLPADTSDRSRVKIIQPRHRF